MPRERVEAVCDPWQPVVGWSHDHGVQVATVAEGDRSVYWCLLGADVEMLVRVGQAVRVTAEAAAHEPTGESVGWTDEEVGRILLNSLDVIAPTSGLWADLNRRGCNDLIRVLRRARDAAFGRDE